MCFVMLRGPTISTPTDTLFPYATRFRSVLAQRRTAVAADVQEYARHSVLAAYHQQRLTQHRARNIVAGLRQFDGQHQCLRPSQKDRVEFVPEPFGAQI